MKIFIHQNRVAYKQYRKQNITNLGYNKVMSIYLSPKYQWKFLYSL